MNFLRKKEFYFYLVLCFILLYAFWVRFLGIKFGLPYLHERDEPQIASTALRILKTGDLSPHSFVYPGFLIYVNLVIDIFHYYYLRAQEVFAFDYLQSLKDIIINVDTGFFWTISHPSFYLWNRAFIVFLSTGCVIITYFILNKSFGKKEGILGALLLSGFYWHIRYSRHILPDTPVSFFVLLVVLFALEFNYSHKIKDLIISIVFVGFTISSKYNAFSVILVPLIVYLLNLKYLKFNKRLIFWVILLLPFIVFLLINPFVLVEFNTFLEHLGEMIRHYTGGVGAEATISPGLNNFLFQVAKIKNSISSFLICMTLGGIFVGFRKRKVQCIILTFPLVYTYFMVQQKVNYHRNFTCIYPFIAIFSSIAIIFISQKLYELGALLKERYIHKIKYLNIGLSLIPFLILISILYDNYIQEFKRALYIWRTPETRTQAIHYLNSIVDTTDMNITIGIAKELRIHRLDLKKLKTEYEIFEHKDINSALKKYDYLVVGEYRSRDKKFHDEDNWLNSLTPKELICHTIYLPSIHGGKTIRDSYSINPKIIILKNPIKDIIKISLPTLQGKKIISQDGSLYLPWGGKLRSQKIKLRKSEYTVSIISKGVEVYGENAQFKIYIGEKLIGDFFTKNNYNEKVFQFKSEEEKETYLVIEFANDYSDPEKGLDRNAWIKEVTIKKL